MKETCIGFESDSPEHCEVNVFISGNQGGDAGHGASATIEFIPNSGSHHLEIEVENEETIYLGELREVKKVSFSMLGDWEMEGLAFALIELGQNLLNRDDIRDDYLKYKLDK